MTDRMLKTMQYFINLFTRNFSLVPQPCWLIKSLRNDAKIYKVVFWNLQEVRKLDEERRQLEIQKEIKHPDRSAMGL